MRQSAANSRRGESSWRLACPEGADMPSADIFFSAYITDTASPDAFLLCCLAHAPALGVKEPGRCSLTRSGARGLVDNIVHIHQRYILASRVSITCANRSGESQPESGKTLQGREQSLWPSSATATVPYPAARLPLAARTVDQTWQPAAEVQPAEVGASARILMY
jgi:hypothetical protein